MPSWLEFFKEQTGDEPSLRSPSESYREKMIESIAGKPKVFTVNGIDMEFFTVGQLAAVLGRRPVTIRKWESDGVLPTTWYNTPSEDPRGRRRLYTWAMLEGIVQIAKEEEILVDTWRPIRKTQFIPRVKELFDRLWDES